MSISQKVIAEKSHFTVSTGSTVEPLSATPLRYGHLRYCGQYAKVPNEKPFTYRHLAIPYSGNVILSQSLFNTVTLSYNYCRQHILHTLYKMLYGLSLYLDSSGLRQRAFTGITLFLACQWVGPGARACARVRKSAAHASAGTMGRSMQLRNARAAHIIAREHPPP